MEWDLETYICFTITFILFLYCIYQDHFTIQYIVQPHVTNNINSIIKIKKELFSK